MPGGKSLGLKAGNGLKNGTLCIRKTQNIREVPFTCQILREILRPRYIPCVSLLPKRLGFWIIEFAAPAPRIMHMKPNKPGFGPNFTRITRRVGILRRSSKIPFSVGLSEVADFRLQP